MFTGNGNGNNDYLLKLNRFARGGRLRLVDLFSGCGGIALGFQRAGYRVVGGVEQDAKAAATFANNFFRGMPEEVLEKHRQPVDITQLHPAEFMREHLRAESPTNLVDVIVGGPPCQAFARIGRAKLREIMRNPNAYLEDGRANLYIHFLEYVEFFRPLGVLIENVSDILNFGGKNVADEIASSLDEMGYEVRYTLLNSALYGVPQFRLRFFLIAFLKELGETPAFPEPKNFVEIPKGYLNNQAVALKKIHEKQISMFEKNYYAEATQPDKGLPNAVNTREAIGDLPEIMYHLWFTGNHRGKSLGYDEIRPYREDKPSEYALLMRNWPSFVVSEEGTNGHSVRLLPRDYPIFKAMEVDDDYPKAHVIAEKLLNVKVEALESETGERIDRASEKYLKLRKETVPPYDPDKFPDKWWKLNPDMPARTLTAHIGKDTYSHIHYDRKQARVISVREAARLQSFPDGFMFAGPMNPAFRQIGNSVPPLMAFALAEKMKDQLEAAVPVKADMIVEAKLGDG